MPPESQTIKGPYKPRRIRRNPIPHLPRYFKTALWNSLKERLEKVEHICFIIVQNGEVNNVYIKTIEKAEAIRKESSPDRVEPSKAYETVQAGSQAGIQSSNQQDNPKAEEALHQNLEEPPALSPIASPTPSHQTGQGPTSATPREESEETEVHQNLQEAAYPEVIEDPGTKEDEIPEETTELPPETPKIVTEPPAAAIKPPPPPIAPPPPASPETPPTAPPEASGTEVEAGHRVKATYENQEVKGIVERVLRESGRADEFITILDSGRKVILQEKDLISLLTTEK